MAINLTLIVALSIFVAACAAPAVSPGRGASDAPPQPKLWEQEVDEIFSNRGVAKIERLGERYLLTIHCFGIHSVYAKGGLEVNLDAYVGQLVHTYYVYVETVNMNTRCIKAPCEPVMESEAVIKRVEKVIVSAEQLARYQATCTDGA
jgi:hypothetical protein